MSYLRCDDSFHCIVSITFLIFCFDEQNKNTPPQQNNRYPNGNFNAPNNANTGGGRWNNQGGGFRRPNDGTYFIIFDIKICLILKGIIIL